jgi:hypothetical protein
VWLGENWFVRLGGDWFVWLGRRMVCVAREGNSLCGWKEIGLCG